jgi:hypothetical protein
MDEKLSVASLAAFSTGQNEIIAGYFKGGLFFRNRGPALGLVFCYLIRGHGKALNRVNLDFPGFHEADYVLEVIAYQVPAFDVWQAPALAPVIRQGLPLAAGDPLNFCVRNIDFLCHSRSFKNKKRQPY